MTIASYTSNSPQNDVGSGLGLLIAREAPVAEPVRLEDRWPLPLPTFSFRAYATSKANGCELSESLQSQNNRVAPCSGRKIRPCKRTHIYIYVYIDTDTFIHAYIHISILCTNTFCLFIFSFFIHVTYAVSRASILEFGSPFGRPRPTARGQTATWAGRPF